MLSMRKGGRSFASVVKRRWVSSGVDLSVFGSKKVGDVKTLERQSDTPDSWTVDADATVFEATKKMVDLKVGSLCVKENGSINGIVTERDYLRKVLHAGKRSKTTQVRDIATMGDKLIVACMEDTLQDCVDVMASKSFRHLPVADESGTIVGLLSIRDIARELANQRLQTIYSLEDQKTASNMPIHDG